MRGEKLRLVICVWILFMHRSCLSSFVVEKNSLKVTSPENLKNTYECAIGNFGVPRYGGTLSGLVTYPKTNQNSCKNFTDNIPLISKKPGSIPVFLLADRGECYFTTKAWNAQNTGASAILVADDRPEHLITMDLPQEEETLDYLQNITIPSVLITHSLGVSIKKALESNTLVFVNLDWTEALPHPDDRVEYEFWTNSNDECGPKCDTQIDFVKSFKGFAQLLERKGYTRFTPHYITWFCPEEYVSSTKCKSQCINHGRYCAPDPEQDFSKGYEGKDVVVHNLRQACFYKVANESGKPWAWWDYVADFGARCSMKEHNFTKNCADDVIKSLGVDVKKIDECMGDPEVDAENAVLKGEQEAQIGKKGVHGDVTILPTLVINNRQYRGKLDKKAVVKAICSGFRETTEPEICLSNEIETNECLHNNGECWMDTVANLTACKDTFRGRVCECPIVEGVKFVGDGYKHCEAPRVPRCQVNNGGCWKSTKDSKNYSACIDEYTVGCKCPPGFKGDGINNCEDIDECKENKVCRCPNCKCKNTWGSYECGCNGNLLYLREHGACLSKDANTGSGWGFAWSVVLGVIAIGVVAYTFYKYRVRRYMDSEIRAIMAQYMPLDNEGEVPVFRSHGDI